MTDADRTEHRDRRPPADRIGIVVIGRNESERLMRSLASIGPGIPAVYVDSGSIDGSPQRAEQAGLATIRLDPAQGFSAARARNAGFRQLVADHPDLAFVQMLDGDCELGDDWLATAAAAMDADPMVGAVFGRRRERFPDRSRYNWLCDVEWTIPAGEAQAFGGDVLLRRTAMEAAGGYSEKMIAGEDPDLSIRLRKLGWRIMSIDAEMSLHDAAILRLGQWWRRAEWGGHGFAELAHRHPGSAWHDYRRSCRSALFWGGLVPLITVAGLIWAWPLAIAAIMLPAVQIARLTLRESKHRSLRNAATLAIFLMLGKYAELAGMIRYHINRLSGRGSRLIEYKGPEAA